MTEAMRRFTLDEVAERTGLPRSALSNYETNESKEVSQFALVTLAKFYGVLTDYLLGLSALENPMQGDIHDLNISSEMAELLKSGKINNRLLCEMATHPDFPKLLMDMEIMVDGEARNAIRAIDMLFEAVRMKIIKETNIGEDSNAQILTFKEAQIDKDEYFEMKIKNDLRQILRFLRDKYAESRYIPHRLTTTTLRFLRDKYAERSEGSRQLEEIEKYVQQLIREADVVREQKEQNVPNDEIWIDRTVAGKAVELPDDDHVEQVLVAVFNHLLKRGTMVCPRGISTVDVVLQNGDVVLLRESRTLADLSFDGFLALVVGRIAGINNGFHRINSI